MSKGRKDLSSKDSKELEELKADLSSSADSDTYSGALFLSTPNSPVSVKSRVASFENLIDIPIDADMAEAELNKVLATLRNSRSGHKTWITRRLNALEVDKNNSSLTKPFLLKTEDSIKESCGKIEEIEIKIVEECFAKFPNPSQEQINQWNTDSESTSTYILATQKKLAEYEVYLDKLAASGASTNATNADLVEALSQLKGGTSKITLTCPTFDGNCRDRFQFKTWLAQFEAVLKGSPKMDDKSKLIYLKTKVTGLACQYIISLELTNENYEVAIKRLKKEFLDVDFIKDELIKQLLNKKPVYDTSYAKTRNYLSDIENIMNDLTKNYSLDCETDGTSGHAIISHVVFAKLSPEIQKSLIAKLNGKVYPSIKEILQHTNQVINAINKIKDLRIETKPEQKPKSDSKDWKPHKSSLQQNSKSSDTMNFATDVVKYKSNKFKDHHCRFCCADGHSSLFCSKYVSLEDRVNRCKELNSCVYCTHPGHTADTCFGKFNNLRNNCKFCNSKAHVSAVCTNRSGTVSSTKSTPNNLCLSTGISDEAPTLLPIFSIEMKGPRGSKVKFNALLDTGSSRSYLASNIVNQLQCDPKTFKLVDYDVKTFLGSGRKSLKEVTLEVHLPSKRYLGLPILVDDQFRIDVEVGCLETVINNFKALNYKLAANFDNCSNIVPVHGLIGLDVIQFIKELRVVGCMHGSAFEIATGIIPFGNCNHFLYPNQVRQLNKVKVSNNYNTIVSKAKCPSTYVNFVLAPKYSYEDPHEHFFDESSVERRIDKMLSCESLGIEENIDEISDYDKVKIDQFKKGIQIIDKQIYVELVWHDSIEQVPSNHDVALKVLNRVSNKLQESGQLEDYYNIFKQQKSEQIIEEFHCDPKDYHKYKWIPHRPIFKTDEQCTTKIRPVFNCSLKTGGRPSLNEASYAGINLMADMLELLMLFRTNKHVLLGDLRKAFLMIKLKSLKDKNRFCFFMKNGDKLICFRYTTIIFGFNASPFILNYVIKHFADTFPNDACTEMLKSCFFVDNLVKTSNSIDHLTDLYKTSASRLALGNFDLRSCNTNHETLKDLMSQDGRLVDHQCEFDKVLGYKYSPSRDVMKLSNCNLDEKANTKRAILSQTSSIFDPLSFVSPVSIRGKTLISSLWGKKPSKNHWDELVSEEAQKTWTTLSKDLSRLSSLEFQRYSLSQDDPANLFIFCDASKRAYGYVAYAVQNGQSRFLFSKPKVAPLSQKSLPTLELLGVFVAFKGLYSILRNLSHIEFNNVYIAVDAQVVLSWLLSDTVKTKNLFAKNRIKDIHKMMKDLQDKYKMPIHFKYVPTDENPADLLTRGLSFDMFVQKLDFWLHGPDWIRSSEVCWPSSDLQCLSSLSKSIVMHTTISNARNSKKIEPIVPFDRYNKFSKLVGVTSTWINASVKLKYLKNNSMLNLWGTADPYDAAKVHLLQVMQYQSFSDEIDFLKDPRNKKVPDLVNNLGLFLDKVGLIRADGRIGKSKYFDIGVLHPILLAKDHILTKLIIDDCHCRVKHLGIQSTLQNVRLSGFWLTKPLQSVKNVISHCVVCKKFNSLSFRYPKVTNLPKHRVNLIRPYLHTGVDYTGHIFVKDGNEERKMYMLIFTCLNIRANHIELVPDMSTNQFVLALCRFTNEYGIPSHIYSDNGRSFIAGVNLVAEVFKCSAFKDRFDVFNIKHVTIPLFSPWVGATWERQIRTIKSCLMKTLGRIKPEYFRLVTILSDIQHAINSRPLTYRCAENFSLEVITPNCFLKPNANSSMILKDLEDNISVPPSRSAILKSIDLRDRMLDEFKDIWYKEYLIGLRDLHRNLHEKSFVNKVRVDEIVLVKNPAHKRHHWKLGRVLELIYGSDNKVRAVKLLRGDVNYRNSPRVEVHSISHLFPLELSLTHNHVARDGLSANDATTCFEESPVDSTLNPVGQDVDASVFEPANLDQDIEPDAGNLSNIMVDPDYLDQAPFNPTVDDLVSSPLDRTQNLVDPVIIQAEPNIVDPSLQAAQVPSLASRPRRTVSRRGRPMDDQFVYE